jgi:hypothetical protein
MPEQLEALIGDCEKCAEVYDEKPGLAGPQAISDLYRAIARLAAIVKAQG